MENDCDIDDFDDFDSHARKKDIISPNFHQLVSREAAIGRVDQITWACSGEPIGYDCCA